MNSTTFTNLFLSLAEMIRYQDAREREKESEGKRERDTLFKKIYRRRSVLNVIPINEISYL